MRMICVILISIFLTSCFNKYTEYTYILRRDDINFIYFDRGLRMHIEILPLFYEFKQREQIVSGPYKISVAISDDRGLLDKIIISKIILTTPEGSYNLFEEEFNIYNSSLKRDYNNSEKIFFLQSKEIDFGKTNPEFINIKFENIDLSYKTISAFKIDIDINLIYKDTKTLSTTTSYQFIRKKNSKYLMPTT